MRGVFVPIFKGKGDKSDMAKYRFICLLNHSYKLLSTLLLRRTTEEVAAYLPDTQAGLRKERGRRDKDRKSTRLNSSHW